MRRLLLKASRSRGVTGRHSLCGQLDFTVERPQHCTSGRAVKVTARLARSCSPLLAPPGTGAAALRAELDQNKVVSGETSIDDAVKAKFRYAGPGGCGRDWKFLLQSMAIRGRKVSPLPTPRYHWVAGGSGTTKGSHPPRSVPGRPLGFSQVGGSRPPSNTDPKKAPGFAVPSRIDTRTS